MAKVVFFIAVAIAMLIVLGNSFKEVNKKPSRKGDDLMDIGHILLDLAQIFAPMIAVLMCAIWYDIFHLSKCHKVIVQSALVLILLLSLLIPLILIGRNR